MGTIYSRRDRLAAAYQMNSFFIMDFTVVQKKVKTMPEYWQSGQDFLLHVLR